MNLGERQFFCSGFLSLPVFPVGPERICPARGVSGSVEQKVEKEEALTLRQIEVLTLVAQGLTYEEVGAKLMGSFTVGSARTSSYNPSMRVLYPGLFVSGHNICYIYAAFRVPKMFGFDFLISTRPDDF